MDNKCQKSRTRRRDQSAENMTEQSSGSADDGRTRQTKRKACPDQTPRKRARGSKPEHRNTQEDLRVRVLKRKVRDDGEGTPKERKKKRLDMNQNEPTSSQELASSSQDNESAGSSSNTEDTDQTSSKKKAAGEGPKRKRRRNRSPAPKTIKKSLVVAEQRAEFQAKYEEQYELGAGGCGCVFAGYRRADSVPVAIKHIPKRNVPCKHVDKDGNKMSIEVAIMLELGSTGSVGTSASVSLLDWYDLGRELILVLERPVPCQDLLDYVQAKGGILEEEDAKIIIKQLVDAMKELEDKKIFHRDIKPENILIAESSSNVPHVRLIDFGLGCFVKEGAFFRTFYGTPDYIPPEWYRRGTYKPGPTTVWQMGVVLYESLHEGQFTTMDFLTDHLAFNLELSKDCEDFLMSCLRVLPTNRPTLEQLQRHPWLR